VGGSHLLNAPPVAGPVENQSLPLGVLLAHDDILPFSSVPTEFAEAAVTVTVMMVWAELLPEQSEREVALAGEPFAKLPEIGLGALGELSLESGRRLTSDTSGIQPATRAASAIIASAKLNAASCANDASCSILPGNGNLYATPSRRKAK
jgi:hypothetical protein